MPSSREFLGSGRGLLHHRAPADQRHIATFPQDEGDIERQGLAIILDVAFCGPVNAGGLQKDNRIRIADRGEQQTVGAFRR